MGDVIKSEKDVRKFVRENFGKRAKFIEPSMGSTKGIPDCYLLLGGLLWIELKSGPLTGDGHVVSDVRPAQAEQIGDLLNDGQKVAMLIGVEGHDKLILTQGRDQMLSGRVRIPKTKDANDGTSLVFETGVWPRLPLLFRDLFFWSGDIPPIDWRDVKDWV